MNVVAGFILHDFTANVYFARVISFVDDLDLGVIRDLGRSQSRVKLVDVPGVVINSYR